MKKDEKTVHEKVTADVREAVLRYGLAKKGDHIVCGLSGGPDSVCLFFALYQLREELGITVSAVHVNHQLRPGAAEEEQQYVETLCERLGVRCRSVVFDCAALAERLGITGEEAGRKKRYEAFDEEAEGLMRTLGKPKEQVRIAVAHNAEDQAETLLFRMIRGTGTDGLAGIERMRKSEKGFQIIRPILGIRRKAIEEYCREKELCPRIDKTNLEAVYTRNKIRLELLPYLAQNLNENIVEALLRLAVTAGEDREYLRQQTEEAFHSVRISAAEDRIELCGERVKALPAALRHRVLISAFSELGLRQDIGRIHIEAADRLIQNGETGKTAEFPAGYRMQTVYGKLAFLAPERIQPEASVGGRFSVKLLSKEEWDEYPKQPSGRFAAFDYEAFCRERGSELPILRLKQPGDFLPTAGGTKKLQDLLVDSKVPREERSRIPIAASGSEILWIPGRESGFPDGLPGRGRFSVKYRVSSDSKTVLLLEI